MSINTGLDLKTRFFEKKRSVSIIKVKYHLFDAMSFEVWGRIFFASDNVQDIFIDFCFITFT